LRQKEKKNTLKVPLNDKAVGRTGLDKTQRNI
jgi:hypothetical protein